MLCRHSETLAITCALIKIFNGIPRHFVLGYSNHIKDNAGKISYQRCKPGSCFLRKVGTTGDGSARIITIAPFTPIHSHYDGEGRISASLVDYYSSDLVSLIPDCMGWFGSWLMLCSGCDGSLVPCLVGILGNQLVTQAAWGQQVWRCALWHPKKQLRRFNKRWFTVCKLQNT